ncbi:MAG: hypothetical protein ACOCZK_05830 [Planctomycetota bacterium]
MAQRLEQLMCAVDRRQRLQRCLGRLLTAWALSLGAVALVQVCIRLALPGWSSTVVWLPVVGLVAPILLSRRWYGPPEPHAITAARLDRLAQSRGLAMALADEEPAARDPGWLQRLRPCLDRVRLPPLDWSGSGRVLVAVLAVLIAVALPQRDPGSSSAGRVDQLLAQPRELLEQMAEEGVLSQERKQELLEQLESIATAANERGMDQAVWEGLDRLAAGLGAEQRRSTQRLAEALAQARRTATADPAARERESAALAQALTRLARQAPGLLPQQGQPGHAELARVLDAAAAQGMLDDEALDRLRERGLLPGAGQGDRGRQGARDPAAEQALAQRLGAALAAAGERSGLGRGDDFARLLQRLGGQPGRGGIARGPGAAALELTHQQQETEPGELEGLPAGARINSDGSVTLAESRRAPELDDAANRALQRARLRDIGPGAADARRARIAPRHRAAVQRYFASEQDDADADDQ